MAAPTFICLGVKIQCIGWLHNRGIYFTFKHRVRNGKQKNQTNFLCCKTLNHHPLSQKVDIDHLSFLNCPFWFLPSHNVNSSPSSTPSVFILVITLKIKSQSNRFFLEWTFIIHSSLACFCKCYKKSTCIFRDWIIVSVPTRWNYVRTEYWLYMCACVCNWGLIQATPELYPSSISLAPELLTQVAPCYLCQCLTSFVSSCYWRGSSVTYDIT